MNGPSYRFRLERVRALRERRESAAKLDLAGALALRTEFLTRLQSDDERIAEARAQAPAPGASLPLRAAELAGRQAYMERLEATRRTSVRELAQQDAELNNRRLALSAAAQDRQVLERLKGRGQAAHAAENLRQEGMELDEMALEQFRRRAA
jgi:flagellar export protein FliJ